ncbi:GNAT family N-acetyltransferase [Flavisolibacter ginsenosidimutans]|uniref:Probable N-acetyltransferase 14 n=2 Tax=Flavisolibacter ginsenosidimutans TaxID=661481 RepID=A0A5B8UPK4_9BACT|nr:GNAT family N-acetyltransferase [Flavisolibacter ginsenosidimutans]
MELKTITTNTPEYEAMIALRTKVLLDPIGIPRSYINPEKERSDVLIGAYEEDNLIGCCILTAVDENTLQLRQMAVDTVLQQKGIGAAILAFAENIAKERGYKMLMMHARDAVIGFYQKCGYQICGEQFFEVGIGHHKMQKQLS